jgi:prepilin-type processing-associated H-X9-DG protein
MKPILLAFGLLFSLCNAACAAPNPAVTAVQQFLTARTAQQYGAAYALLSRQAQQTIPYNQFIAPNNFRQMTQEMSSDLDEASAFSAVLTLFADTHNTSGYSFAVVGTEPSQRNTVLVNATSKDPKITAQVLKIVVVMDSSHWQLDLLQSLNATSPVAFEKARQNAQTATSMSNLKQLALGVIQYTQDHDEHLPEADKWVDELLPYVKSEAIFHDPSAPASQKWSYAFNQNLSGKPLAQFDAPADTVMLFESNLGVKNASDTGASVPVPGRHQGGTDYALADGHVKWFADGTKLSYALSGK